MARQVAEAGGSAPIVLNAANEVAVNGFCEGRLRFTDIPDFIQCALDNFCDLTVDDVVSITRLDQLVRETLQNRLDAGTISLQQIVSGY
jgi:1-deoxy-D-xylulose-5-phosphate reductoisomerase